MSSIFSLFIRFYRRLPTIPPVVYNTRFRYMRPVVSLILSNTIRREFLPSLLFCGFRTIMR